MDDGLAGSAGAPGERSEILTAQRKQPTRGRNTRLRAAMADRRVSFAQLAAATGHNIKTAQRWVYEGRVPRVQHAAAIARYLDIDANWLWPRVRAGVNPELINLYANIREVPRAIWNSSASAAQQTIEIAADTAPVLPYDLADILVAKAGNGVPIRCCLAESVLPAVGVAGVWTRINPARHMLGIYRFDGEMLVWLNRVGGGAEQPAPVLHLRQSEEHGVFDFYRMMFTQLWEDGEAIAHHEKDWYRART